MDSVRMAHFMLSLGNVGVGFTFLSGPGRFFTYKLDQIFFPSLRDERIFRAGDQLACLVCVCGALLNLLITLYSIMVHFIPFWGFVFIVASLILATPVRFLFLLRYQDRLYEEIPRLWPFKK